MGEDADDALLAPVYRQIGGSTDEEKIHGMTFVQRPNWLIMNETQHLNSCTVPPHNHRVYYFRFFGGETKERRRDEQPPKEATHKVFLVQGLGGTHCQWQPQIEFFASDARFDVVAIDNRGIGLSEVPPGRWKTSEMAQDVNYIIRHELKWCDDENNSIHLMGFSLGGMIALECGLSAPQMFASIALLSTHGGGVLGTMLPPWGIRPFLSTFGKLGSPNSLSKGMALLHSQQYLNKKVSPQDYEALVRKEPYLKTLVEDELRLPKQYVLTNRLFVARNLIQRARKYVESGNAPEIKPHGIIRQISAAISHYVGWDRLAYLTRSEIEFIVMAGTDDNLVNVANARMLGKALMCETVIYEGVGHGVTDSNEEQVNRTLLDTIERGRARWLLPGVRQRKKALLPYHPSPYHPWKSFVVLFVLIAELLRRQSRWPLVAMHAKKFSLLFTSVVMRVFYGPLTI